MILFISGGARSGKSYFAEQTALSLHNKVKGRERSLLYYIATAKKSDDEMVERIRIHQQDRGDVWKTVEEPFDIERILANCNKEDVILLDCLTIWLSNVMFELNYSLEKLEKVIFNLLSLAREKQFHLMIVSNDVNVGIPTSYDSVFTYMYSLQRIHQRIIEQSDIVVEVQAGIPTYWKGAKWL
ncbi:bifunctional adenosylcobinamide kinase/adenosylcobinamide-phosphate guanylyltransferase [Ureibacillus acetophenoni]|uniref:Adenosylcobinamide kinase n=1 Tax=Ureibacillus acetophenoni TaxID=614649 RepID=A0A285UMK4_9BACL|nr:bifunctional adenosylcobinamide kinase/adenosylcobinamide-phosphate guanylyltransferase [Ureibacillus acetophenoni]SOC43079.1 adenosylcobinamide kinase /adenosylcobinamide-phosphate guanylyltransferase [Ureibacillus acetophenoni]